jgi:16S rRNA (uracil1498-N3)-methyltransferase
MPQSLPRFMLTAEQLRAEPVRLMGPDAQHARVLRLAPGDTVLVSDGLGHEFSCRISLITPTLVELISLQPTSRQSEPELEVTLYQGLARGSKLEFTIQKTTEVGVFQVVPVICAHSQIKPDQESSSRLKRWQEIARQAARQSGRTRVPEIQAPLAFARCLEQAKTSDLSLLLDEAKQPQDYWKGSVADLPRPRRVALFVGPEGSFSAEEKNRAAQSGVRLVGLGPRILRSETAGVIAVTLALFQWGDLGGEWPNVA